jgi:hypothetical protein
LQGFHEGINPRRIAKNTIYYSISSVNIVECIGGHRSPRFGGGEGGALQGFHEGINPRKIARNTIYYSISSVHIVECTGGHRSP